MEVEEKAAVATVEATVAVAKVEVARAVVKETETVEARVEVKEVPLANSYSGLTDGFRYLYERPCPA